MKKIIMQTIVLTMLVGVVAAQSANAQTTPIPKVPQHEKLIGFSCSAGEYENFDAIVLYLLDIKDALKRSKPNTRNIAEEKKLSAIQEALYFTCTIGEDWMNGRADFQSLRIAELPREKYEYLYFRFALSIVVVVHDSYINDGFPLGRTLEQIASLFISRFEEEDKNGEMYAVIAYFYKTLQKSADEYGDSYLAEKYERMADEVFRRKKVEGFIARQEEWHWQEDDKISRYIEHILNMDSE